MLDKIDQTIQDIAVQHGVALGKDDPILIFQTINNRLLEENRKAQQDLLAQFKEEMENISSRWKEDAQIKAEKILNIALLSTKETMAKLLQESTSESVQAMKKMISDSLAETRDLAQQTRKCSWVTLLSSAAILIVSCLFMFLEAFSG
ncbi:conjugal transfer protein TraM [Legionella sp. km772]|uniref:conjugal transfer protein TraM n=1 Tax=Legionella sp. km772 TaxID=2498111 RepID=UPI000F8E327E|nr:conjugal transfer protein TraM [Legionella sp. km772]RUR14267.1 conjugal transfer protein TraM [Legionella sp. km772]